MIHPVTILGIDTGYCGTGLAIVEHVPGNTPKLLRHAIVHTEPSSKKLRMLVVDDHLRRIREIYNALDKFMTDEAPDLVALEAFSPSRNSGSALRQAFAYAVVVSVITRYGIPLVQFTPQQVRKRLGIEGKAQKMAVWESAGRVLDYDGYDDQIIDTYKTNAEHVLDATCAALAALVPQPVDLVLALSRR